MTQDVGFARKFKIAAISVVGVFIVVGGLISLGVLSLPIPFAHDSPVEVAGGSVYGSVNLFNGWTELRPQELYATGSTNKDWIKTEGLTEVGSNAPAGSNTTPLQNTGGWVIGISVKKNGGNRRSISFCSGVVALQPPDPVPVPACIGQPLSGTNIVYLQANGNAKWRKRFYKSRHQLVLKNHQGECDADTDPESDCQNIMYIRIQTQNNVGMTNGIDYQCLDSTICKITIGN